MFGSRGFTLLELMVAITLLAVGFSALFDVLSRARLDHYYTQSLKEDLFELNNRLVEGKREGLVEEKKRLEDYPEIEEVSYKLGSAEILIYQLKR
ncbi:MAG: prepilin-type N-terminal cleavage/methylation domain-containing protein [Aquificaceae bacterium]|nr:prepilin-type N-terminal cleavage/methylation domain-containing protein [Aquificaceae bacterium]MCX7990137.1 prepilin-type N-terminal cleavage/methylation domain-containing protein [Aquificaceae bacterium]